jgi:hypothetical protein
LYQPEAEAEADAATSPAIPRATSNTDLFMPKSYTRTLSAAASTWVTFPKRALPVPRRELRDG